MRDPDPAKIDYASSSTPAVRLNVGSLLLRLTFAAIIAAFGLMFFAQGFFELSYIDWLWRTSVGKAAIMWMALGLLVMALGIGFAWRAVYRFTRDRRLS